MNNNIALSDIRTFVAIAQHESFTQAADAVGVSRAHLTRQLQRLERELSVQLIRRTTRSVVLTQEGQGFFDKCRNAIDAVDQAVLDVKENNHALRGKIKINTVGGVIGEELIAPMIADFSAQHPNIQIDVDFSSHRVDVVSQNYDLVIRMGELDDSGLYAKKLTDIKIGAYASPKYVDEFGPIKHPQDLENMRCLAGSVKKWVFKHNASGDESTVNVKGHIGAKNGRVLLEFAKKHAGVVRLPRLYCDPYLETGELIEVLTDWHVEDVPLYFVYYNPENQPERITALIHHIKKCF